MKCVFLFIRTTGNNLGINTPDLVRFYDEIKPKNPHFELIFVCHDDSSADMEKYMRIDAMKWPALKFSKIHSHKSLNKYCGKGIPDLVLVDAQGKVLSDSYVGGNYIGPRKVVQDIKKILEQNPPQAETVAPARIEPRSPVQASPLSVQADQFSQLGKEEADKQFVVMSQKEAVARYPNLGVAGSALNKEYVARLKRYQAEKREFFTEPDWPMRLAKEIAGEKKKGK